MRMVSKLAFYYPGPVYYIGYLYGESLMIRRLVKATLLPGI